MKNKDILAVGWRSKSCSARACRSTCNKRQL